jgi:hypothetical protein
MKNKLHVLVIVFILGFSIVYDKNVRWTNWNGEFWKNTINGDGRGYYAYLPAIFIYHDLNFDFVKKTDNVPEIFVGNFLNEKDGKKFDKYFIGVAVLLLPFFSIAYLLSVILGYSLDGYSQLFQYSVSFAALFYLTTGLFFIVRLLQS